jgi:predicted Zn finger-like uncharacterized protein
MIIQCESCARKFAVKDDDIPAGGRTVQCGYCAVTWHQMPNILEETKILKIGKVNEISEDIDDDLSVEKIKASDGKTYKFLGSQWAQILPSGKTGLFAKKKIGKELDKLTGRKIKNISTKKRSRKELDPSSGSLSDKKQLPDIYKTKHGLGFFGYFFLIVIIGFSFVGLTKTFENSLINYFPEIEYFFQLLDEQLEYFSETFANIIVIIRDLINSY